MCVCVIMCLPIHSISSIALFPQLMTSPKDTLVFKGSTIVLPCYGIAYPHPFFRWTRNHVTFSLSNSKWSGSCFFFNFFIGHTQSTATFNGTLTISSAMSIDGGNYQCVVTSSEEFRSSKVAIVTVIGKYYLFHVYVFIYLFILKDTPNILKAPEDRIVITGSTVYLDCLVEDTSLITETYIWSRDSHMIRNNAHTMVFDNGTLRVSNFSSDGNAGEYECKVKLKAESSQAMPLYMNVGTAFVTTGKRRRVKEYMIEKELKI